MAEKRTILMFDGQNDQSFPCIKLNEPDTMFGIFFQLSEAYAFVSWRPQNKDFETCYCCMFKGLPSLVELLQSGCS